MIFFTFFSGSDIDAKLQAMATESGDKSPAVAGFRFCIQLDHRLVRTPMDRILVVPTLALGICFGSLKLISIDVSCFLKSEPLII